MPRATIDYGIDLGTTNSAIARQEGADITVFRNNEGFEYTPSAVWIDRQGRLFVGRRAKEQLETDPQNAYCEFKLQMGLDHAYQFARSGRSLRPEELSAEVLKSLRRDASQRTGEEIEAAVITVPAAFELPQCEATNRAAQLAGFALCPLLQEPVAAALAYGFQTEADGVFWLVYDFGGGTFDAAVIQVRDGVLEVVNHAGDPHLGGKLLDWAIVDHLLIPAVTREHPLTDFRRGNLQWQAAIAKLKLAAEAAKIACSRDESAEINIEFLCQNDSGERVEFWYDLQRADVERLMEPFVVRSINICRQVLQEKRLGPGHVQSVLLVGGPTMTPYVRQRLADPVEGLGIPLELRVDPLTVVARGAAIFAATQRLNTPARQAPTDLPAGSFLIRFPEWRFSGSDTEPLVAGVVGASDGRSMAGCTVEFINAEARPEWRSGKLPVAANGGFMTQLWAERGQPATYRVELCDPTGRPVVADTDPDPLTYRVGLDIPDPPLIHSVGVALVNNEAVWLVGKGAALPARGRSVLRTASEVRAGNADDIIRIPVVEGENLRADRNRRIGNFEIPGTRVRRTLPANSEVEFTIEIDRSRLVTTRAYVPQLDEEYEEVLQLGRGAAPDPATLRRAAEREEQRLAAVRDQAANTGDTVAGELLRRIDRERMAVDVQDALTAASNDPDAADKCDKRLLELRAAIDQVEDALEWPALVAEAQRLMAGARQVVEDHGDRDDEATLERLEAAVRQALPLNDAQLLRQRVEELRRHALIVLQRRGVLQVMHFQDLQERRADMRDQQYAYELISQGNRAMQANDPVTLQEVNRQLAALLPTPLPEPDLSTVWK